MTSESAATAKRGTAWFAKGSSLFLISVLEVGTPFVRMVILARFLDLRELGFASALAATYATLEMTSDIAIHRFVFGAAPDEFNETIASAQALLVLRGLGVGLLAVVLAPFVAGLLSLGAHWKIFAALGGIVLLRAFENLEPRVAERNYQFGAQMKIGLLASALSLTALAVTVYLWRDHTAIVMSLLGQTIGVVAGSQILARVRYQLSFRSEHFRAAFRFAYPLMFNGVGLAVSAQGDRFLVGALLGLQTLGLYSIVLLVTIVPLTMVFRIIGTINLAAFHNASLGVSLARRVRFAARLSPLVGTLYALGILTLMNVVTPRAFGARFTLTRVQLCLLALGAFFRLIRVEPFSSLLLHNRRTKRMAAGNLSTIAGYTIAIPFIIVYRTIDTAFVGRLLGEVIGLFTTVIMSRRVLAGHLLDYCVSAGLGLLLVGAGCAGVWWSLIGFDLLSGIAALGLSCLIIVPWGLWIIYTIRSSQGIRLFGR